MPYDQYIGGNKPLWLSGIMLPLTLLLPILILVFEGWHNGVPCGAFLAIQISVLVPGIYLLRPLVFCVWVVITVVASSLGMLTIHLYWNSMADWMDAEIPTWVLHTIKVSLWLILSSSVALGILGWLKYFKRRRIS